MALQETSGPVRNPLEKDCFGKRFRHVQTGFPQDVGHFPKMEVSCVVQGSQALLAYHWARQASLSWFQTVLTTMDLNWFQDRREKSMKLYQFTLESVRIKHLQWSSAFISKFLVALPPFLKLSLSARPRSRPMRCTRFLPLFCCTTLELLWMPPQGIPLTVSRASHGTCRHLFFQIVTCVQQKQYEARVFQNGCVWKWGSAW